MQEGPARRDHRRTAERPPGHHVPLPGPGALTRSTLTILAVAIAFGIIGGRVLDGDAAPIVGGAAFLALLLGFWWIRGGRGWRIDVSRDIPAPPATVFAILDDPARQPELDPRILAVDAAGGPGLGRRERMHARVMRRDAELEATVVEHDPGARLAYDARTVAMNGKPLRGGTQRQTFELSPAGDATRVRLTIRGAPAGAGERLAIGVQGPGERRAARAMLRRLADLAVQPRDA